MIHQLLYNGAGHVLHDVAVDHGGYDGDGYHVAALQDDVPDLLILDAHDVLAVNLQQVVVDQQSVPGSGGVHGYGGDLSFFELEANVSCRVLVEGESPLEGPIPDDHDDVVDGGLVLQNVMDFV